MSPGVDLGKLGRGVEFAQGEIDLRNILFPFQHRKTQSILFLFTRR